MSDLWTDPKGNINIVPSHNSCKRLRATKIPAHKKIKAYVLERDEYCCRKCFATSSENIKWLECWSDKWQKHTFLVIDHILSIKNGGTHHPNNLQVLCDLCNSQKVGLEDIYGL